MPTARGYRTHKPRLAPDTEDDAPDTGDDELGRTLLLEEAWTAAVRTLGAEILKRWDDLAPHVRVLLMTGQAAERQEVDRFAGYFGRHGTAANKTAVAIAYAMIRAAQFDVRRAETLARNALLNLARRAVFEGQAQPRKRDTRSDALHPETATVAVNRAIARLPRPVDGRCVRCGVALSRYNRGRYCAAHVYLEEVDGMDEATVDRRVSRLYKAANDAFSYSRRGI